MENTFLNGLENATNFTRTENGALAHKITKSNLLDLFALGSSYRGRSKDDIITLFKAAYDENPDLALRCLFYIRDAIDGTGERRFFRICYNWLAKEHTDVAMKNMQFITFYGIGRWDDYYCLVDTPLEQYMFIYLKQVAIDAYDMVTDPDNIDSITDQYNNTLIFKWLKSENTSSPKSRLLGRKTRMAFGLTSKEYRKFLSYGRKKINVLERLMSDNDWDKIEFDKIPSRAGLIYSKAFGRREETKEKYEAFVNSKDTKINTKVLYPYELVHAAINAYYDDTQRAAINKMWDNLPNVFKDEHCSMICVCDTSGSMFISSSSTKPIDVSIGLSMYCAEHLNGPFKDKFITFSSHPDLVDISKGVDFVEKATRIKSHSINENTNLTAVFDLLLKIADSPYTKEEDIPETVCVISDMEIDDGTIYRSLHGGPSFKHWTKNSANTEMEIIRQEWNEHGHKMPRLIYWNVNAKTDVILDSGENVSFVSGSSQNTFKTIVTGKNGYDLMLEAINAEKYKYIGV